MRLRQIRIQVDAGISAFECASRGRKLVRQVDTGIRHLDRMNKNTQNIYGELVQSSGHYSKNPIKRIISYCTAWNHHRKNLVECYKKLYV